MKVGAIIGMLLFNSRPTMEGVCIIDEQWKGVP